MTSTIADDSQRRLHSAFMRVRKKRPRPQPILPAPRRSLGRSTPEPARHDNAAVHASPLRSIPSVDRVLRDLGDTGLPRPAVVAVVRRELAAVRSGRASPPDEAGHGQPTDSRSSRPHPRGGLDDLPCPRSSPVHQRHRHHHPHELRPVPAGRRRRSAPCRTSPPTTATSNTTWPPAGAAGGRRYVEHNLALLCGAEAATVVNNCAAALVLILRHFASTPPRTQVVISRGELVQIGGGFRVPEILEASGATLREVGTTNQTTADDYARAIDDRTAMVLKVHRSNFYMGGFVESPGDGGVAAVARERGRARSSKTSAAGRRSRPKSLGGGEHEPTPAEALRQRRRPGLLQRRQASRRPAGGHHRGPRRLTSPRSKREPFFRALRCDKLVLAALQATVDSLLAGPGGRIPDPRDDATTPARTCVAGRTDRSPRWRTCR